MVNYLIVSSLTLVILYFVYFLVLRQERTFEFNRYFLVGSLVLGVILPFLEIPVDLQKHDESPQLIAYQSLMDEVTFNHDEAILVVPEESFSLSWHTVLLALYLLGLLIMTVRFARSLLQLVRLKKDAHCEIESDHVNIYSSQVKHPFTFFRWIYFQNESQRADYNLFRHELVHARQWHSFDILLVEVLMIVFWFQPIIYLFRKSISLNHEFIADRQVVSATKTPTDYLHKILNMSGQPMKYSLVSNFSFISLKNRLKMLQSAPVSGRNSFWKMATACLVALGLFSVFAFSIKPPLPSPTKEFVVILDAGHGGEDAGATSEFGLTEKEIVANITQKVQAKLSSERNIKIILTRENDTNLELSERVAQTAKADLFLSLHVENHQNHDQDFAFIIYYERNELSEKAEYMAQVLANEIENCGKECKVGYSDYYVLVNSKCPAVMLNLGFLSNKEDAEYMSSTHGQEEIAQQVFRAIKIAAI